MASTGHLIQAIIGTKQREIRGTSNAGKLRTIAWRSMVASNAGKVHTIEHYSMVTCTVLNVCKCLQMPGSSIVGMHSATWTRYRGIPWWVALVAFGGSAAQIV